MKPTKAQRRDITAGFRTRSRRKQVMSYCVTRSDGTVLALFEHKSQADKHAEFLGEGYAVKAYAAETLGGEE